MASQPIYSADDEQKLMVELWDPLVANDPRNFVRLVYPWGQPNTPLEHETQPRQWQDDVMKEIAEYIAKANRALLVDNTLLEMFREAVASGRGIGKSALFSWLAHWLVSTRLGASVWVAANGEPQLKTKTFPEIAKWVNMSMNAHWFDINATSIVPAKWFAEAVQRDRKIDPKYWYIQAQLWSEESPDAFAGAHNVHGEMYLFDEASGIPSPIWTVAQGVFTEKTIDRYWLAFSNPRSNTGAFFECFNKNRNFWRTRNIDARTVEGIPPDTYNAIIAAHGEDSDEARVEVYGQFPNSTTNQFIRTDVVENAQSREIIPDPGAPLLIGVDVARFGEDKSVIAFRKGRDARSIPWQKYHGIDTVTLAGHVAKAATDYKADAIFVDGNGVGGGVVDLLKSWGYKVIEVQAGSSASDQDKYFNKRVEMWGLAKEWLDIGCIPIDDDLRNDLTKQPYKYHPVTNQYQLPSKDEMKSKFGLASPDVAEALVMTFASPVARVDDRHSRHFNRRHQAARGRDYSLLG